MRTCYVPGIVLNPGDMICAQEASIIAGEIDQFKQIIILPQSFQGVVRWILIYGGAMGLQY